MDRLPEPGSLGESLEGFITDPQTRGSYFATISDDLDTASTSFFGDEFEYHDNVGLTAVALLDGIKRSKKIDPSADTSQFLDDVIEETKRRKQTALSSEVNTE